MDYISVTEAAKKWNVPVRTLRHYCETGKIEGAQLVKSSWLIPDSEFRPMTKGGRSLALSLLYEKNNGIKNGLYAKLAVDFTYNSLKISDYDIPYEYIKNIFEGEVKQEAENLLSVDYIVAINNCFKCIDFIIENCNKMLSEKFVRLMYLVLNAGISDFDLSQSEKVNTDLKTLIDVYNSRESKNMFSIIAFSYSFNQLQPFNRSNYFLSKLIVLKEAMKYRFTPFIIYEDRKKEYLDAVEVFLQDKKPLMREVALGQSRFKDSMKYFNVQA